MDRYHFHCGVCGGDKRYRDSDNLLKHLWNHRKRLVDIMTEEQVRWCLAERCPALFVRSPCSATFVLCLVCREGIVYKGKKLSVEVTAFVKEHYARTGCSAKFDSVRKYFEAKPGVRCVGAPTGDNDLEVIGAAPHASGGGGASAGAGSDTPATASASAAASASVAVPAGDARHLISPELRNEIDNSGYGDEYGTSSADDVVNEMLETIAMLENEIRTLHTSLAALKAASAPAPAAAAASPAPVVLTAEAAPVVLTAAAAADAAAEADPDAAAEPPTAEVTMAECPICNVVHDYENDESCPPAE